MTAESPDTARAGSSDASLSSERLDTPTSNAGSSKSLGMKRFWMVVRHDAGHEAAVRGRMPTIRHETRESAEAEAERLVVKERTTFYVLQVVSKHFGQFVHCTSEAFEVQS